MKRYDTKLLKELAANIDCRKGLICYKSGFRKLCKAKDIGEETFLECLDDDATDCVFSSSYGDSHFCECPLRIYLATKYTL